MRLIISISIFIVLCIFNSNGQIKSQKIETLNSEEISLKVWQETETEYKQFIEKQSEIRKKLDKHLEEQDLEKLEVLKTAYEEKRKEIEDRGKLILQVRKGKQAEIISELWQRMSNRLKYQIRCQTEILVTMLNTDKELYKIADYLSSKYNLHIKSIEEEIQTEYKKLKNAERKVYLKYNRQEDEKNAEIEDDLPKPEDSFEKKINIYGNTKVLIIESKK